MELNNIINISIGIDIIYNMTNNTFRVTAD